MKEPYCFKFDLFCASKVPEKNKSKIEINIRASLKLNFLLTEKFKQLYNTT